MAKLDNNCRILAWAELEEKNKGDPELAKQMDAAKRVIERYSKALQQLADSRSLTPCRTGFSTAAKLPPSQAPPLLV